MANWLSRATEAFRKPPPPAPEPFSVRCDCGGTVTGFRVSGPQRPACSNCGRPVFVLPANVYPVPVPKKRAPDPSAEKVSEAPLATSATARAARSRPAPASSESTVEPPAGILVESRTRLLTPFRLIVAAIIGIGVVTVWGLWHRHRIESAKAHVLAANEAGMKALREGDFVVAARELVRARDAVDILGRTDPEASTIRRYCREAVAGHELSDTGLFDLLEEYAADSRRGEGRLRSSDRGAWLVLDATIANPDAGGPCVLDMPLAIDGVKFRIEVDSSVVKSAAAREAARGARVIFAAQLAEIRPPTGKRPAVIVLAGPSAFLWTTLETYAALGYADDGPEELNATRDLLARQLEHSEDSQ